jgi:hypothetical protein
MARVDLKPLARKVDDLKALGAKVDQREEGRDLGPVLLERSDEQWETALLASRGQWKSLDQSGQAKSRGCRCQAHKQYVEPQARDAWEGGPVAKNSTAEGSILEMKWKISGRH